MILYFNQKSAIEKKIDDINLYIKLSNLYKRYFEEFLCSIVDLKKYDLMFKDSDLGFSACNVDNPTLNILNDYLSTSFIYNLNYYFVEKLSVDDLEILQDDNFDLLMDMIRRTYKDVLKNDSASLDEDYNICYGESTDTNFARNDAIVFKIYYKIDDDNNDITEFLIKDKKIKNFLDYVISSIKNEIEKKLDINCDILTEMCIDQFEVS